MKLVLEETDTKLVSRNRRKNKNKANRRLKFRQILINQINPQLKIDYLLIIYIG
jgi:hypothetical protein